VLNGDAGDGLFVLDAAGQGPQSYEYYSTPRMFTLGLIRIAGELIPVDGLSWNDHEFFNMPAGETFPSWDWFSIQLDDGASIMLYGLRLADGSYDPDSRGTFIAKDGTVTHLVPSSFTLTPGTTTWTSPNSGATYPIEWQISIPSLAINLHMTTPLANQEMLQSNPFDTPTYWEGASRFTGTRNGQPVTGKGYLEMLGYAPVSPTP
jgi:predicted secreted hydrolase